MRNRFVFAVAMLALLCASNPVMAKTTFPAIGGPGDAPFEDTCPAHQFLIGLAGRGGLWIDQVQLICAPIQPDGTHGPKYYGVPYGGGGGGPIEFSCALNSFVSAARIYTLASSHLRVVRVELTCFSKEAVEHTPGRFSLVEFTAKDPSTTRDNHYEDQLCPNDELAIGFHGSSGNDVNAMGLDCEVRSARPTATATPFALVPAKPIRVTGRPAPGAVSSSAPAVGPGALACPQGYVWRVASPKDFVCVTPLQRRIAAAQNAAAAAHVSQTDRTYGPNSCVAGFVWREAFSGDVICVTPAERDAALRENNDAPQLPSN